LAEVKTGRDLRENVLYWELPLEEKTVRRCFLDNAFGLELGDAPGETTLRIEGNFVVSREQASWRLSPERPQDIGPALSLVKLVVRRARAFKDGTLEVSFADGSTLRVPSDPEFEPWVLSANDGMRVVSLPGGDLAIWK
jgi:hypothetical protein